MFFSVLEVNRAVPTGAVSQAFLKTDMWDDWGKFRTQFSLHVFDHKGERHVAGQVKIGHFGLEASNSIGPNKRAPALNAAFDQLPDGYFSLGQDENYYETINRLPDDLRLRVLHGLRDVAFDLDLFERASGEYVMSESLLRGLSTATVTTRLHRLALGDAALTAFQFAYRFPPSTVGSVPPPVLDFVVEPGAIPPTNVHVLIGRNGVGKTTCMQNIGRSLLGAQDAQHSPGAVIPLDPAADDWSFAGLISVSFSAFDNFDLPTPTHPGISASMIGLRQTNADGTIRIKTPPELAQDFTKSFEMCRTGLRAERWLRAVNTLSNDPLFADANVASLLELSDEEWEIRSEKFYSLLSSGHKIVLLTVTRLVELVDERSLVLLDEPEGHLHPPLLSAFIRSLADLLVQRNGVAIIATHSPVVLQEVPRSSVWILRRSGAASVAERPSIETFGENVGVLTREVFGLEVTTAGFHQLLTDTVMDTRLNYEQVIHHFGDQLGAEARAIARGLIATRDAGG